VSCVYASLFAQDTDNFEWQVYQSEPGFLRGADNIIITGYTGTSREVTIPWEINGIPVRAIGAGAFRGRNLTSVTIRAHVERIDQGAFAGNPLTRITIGRRVQLKPDSFGQIYFYEAYLEHHMLNGTYTRSSTESREWLWGESYRLETGNEYHILHYRANVRSGPGRNSDVIAILRFNDKVKIMENTEIQERINGVRGYWYKIQYGNITGYMFGGSLAASSLLTDIDNNGIIDSLHFRYSRPERWNNFNSHTDVIIYINNQRINTSTLNEWSFDTHRRPFSPIRETDQHHFVQGIFEEKDDHVLIILRNFGRHDYEWTTVYKINALGEISFFEWTEGFTEFNHETGELYSSVAVRVRRNENGEMIYSGRFGHYWEGWDKDYVPEPIENSE